MSDTQTLKRVINNIIIKNKLYGRSFTYGVALRIAMRDQLLYDDLDRVVEGMLEDIYGEVLDTMREAGLKTDLYALAGAVDPAVLDEIVRHLTEEDEE